VKGPASAPSDPSEWLAGVGQGKDLPDYLRAASTWDSDERSDATRVYRKLTDDRKMAVAIQLGQQSLKDSPPELQGEVLHFLIVNPPPLAVCSADLRVMERTTELAIMWGEQDPSAASRWIASLPEGPGRQWAAKNLAARWAVHEPAAVHEWIATLPEEDSREVLLYLENAEITRRR